jgi:hypothetical protein
MLTARLLGLRSCLSLFEHPDDLFFGKSVPKVDSTYEPMADPLQLREKDSRQHFGGAARHGGRGLRFSPGC